MNYWDFYTNRNAYKGNPKFFFKKIKNKIKDQKEGEKERNKNLEELEKIRDRRRASTTKFSNIVNVVLIIGVIVILWMIFNVAENLIQ